MSACCLPKSRRPVISMALIWPESLRRIDPKIAVIIVAGALPHGFSGVAPDTRFLSKALSHDGCDPPDP